MSEELHKCQKDLSLMSDKLKERSQALTEKEMKGLQKRDAQVQFNKDGGENTTVKSEYKCNRSRGVTIESFRISTNYRTNVKLSSLRTGKSETS